MDAWTTLLLAVQAALALVGAIALRRRVLPGLARNPHPALVTDVWGPLAIAGPLLFHAAPLTDTVRGAGWVAIGAPVALGVLGVGAGICRRGSGDDAPPLATAAIWGGAGLILLLLGAAHDLSVAAGQCAFALSAVLLWCNTPVPGPPSTTTHEDAGGAALLLVIACGLGQGVVTMNVASGGGRLASAAIAIAYGLAAVLPVRGVAPASMVRLAGWTAGLGLLMGLGILSMLRLIPLVLIGLRDRTELPPGVVRVASGFGSFALEATLLLAAAGVVATLGRAETPVRRAVGIVLIVLSSALLAIRMASILATHDIL
jgi:hypothetical protein